MNQLTLYTHPHSRGRNVRWMLEECSADYKVIGVPFGAAMKAPEYRAINPDYSVLRVAERVKQGGHNIPEATIRRRFAAGLPTLTPTAPPSTIGRSMKTPLTALPCSLGAKTAPGTRTSPKHKTSTCAPHPPPCSAPPSPHAALPYKLTPPSSKPATANRCELTQPPCVKNPATTWHKPTPSPL